MFWCTTSGLVFGACFEITIVHTLPPSPNCWAKFESLQARHILDIGLLLINVVMEIKMKQKKYSSIAAFQWIHFILQTQDIQVIF